MAKLTIALMDSPYESATTTTAMRIIDAAVRKGHEVNVFAYEGAVSLTMKEQKGHPNPVKGTTLEEQKHPTTANFVAGLMATGKVDWINCGMCVDERGALDWIEGPRRGGPGDLIKWANESDNTLIMGTR